MIWIYPSTITVTCENHRNDQKQSPRGALKISENSQQNTCARVLLKKRLWHRCFRFLVNFAKFLGTPFYRTPPLAASK